MIFKHEYKDLDIYIIRGSDNRIWDKTDELYLEFIQSNTPEKISGDRFIIIVNGEVTVDPNKEFILLAETKKSKLESIRNNAQSLIYSVYPIWFQFNADSGIYPVSIAEKVKLDIASVIEVSNKAEEGVENAQSIDEVDVIQPIFPTIGDQIIRKFNKVDFDFKRFLRDEIKNNPVPLPVNDLRDRVDKVEKATGVK